MGWKVEGVGFRNYMLQVNDHVIHTGIWQKFIIDV